jgi:putative membrane protein
MQIAAIPYCGPAPVPAELAARWNFDPALLLVLIAAFVVCRAHSARLAPLTLASATVLVVFVSPLCALASALFSARVAHHVLLTALGAPLIAAAWPRAAGRLVPWTLGHAAIFWAWHAPPAYAFALAATRATG